LGETGFLQGYELPPITTNLAPFDPARRRDSNGAIFVKFGQELADLYPNIKYRLEETGFLQGCEPPPITTNLAPFDPARRRDSNGAISVRIGLELAELYCNMKFRLGETGFLLGCETAPITANLAPFDPARWQDSNGAIFVRFGQEQGELYRNMKFRLGETGFLQGCELPPIKTN